MAHRFCILASFAKRPSPATFMAAIRCDARNSGQFGDSGRSYWRCVSYRLDNSKLDNFTWIWEASSGENPDQYQRERHDPDPWQSSRPKALARPRLFVLDSTPRRQHLPGRLHQCRRCRRHGSSRRGQYRTRRYRLEPFASARLR